MPKIKISDDVIKILKRRNSENHPFILIVDGGGGDYSIEDGSCSLGMDYSLILLDTRDNDPRYPITFNSNTNFTIFTSDYDLAFLGDNLILDLKNTTLRLRNDSGLLTGAVKIARASDLQRAAKNGFNYIKNC